MMGKELFDIDVSSSENLAEVCDFLETILLNMGFMHAYRVRRNARARHEGEGICRRQGQALNTFKVAAALEGLVFSLKKRPLSL